MKRHPSHANGSEFADSAFFKRSGYFSSVSISDCKQAIDTGQELKFKQGLLVKHVQELAKPSLLVPGALHWWAGVGNDQSTTGCISGCRKAINRGQKLAEKEPVGLKCTQ